eukprot:symbB.v1.2.017597.t1/scaffold1362.1/size123397/4
MVGQRLSRVVTRARGGEEDSEKLAVGDVVSAICPDDSQWYPGTIEKINDDSTFCVKWDDPEGGPETHDVPADGIKKIVIYKDYKVGETVEAVFPEDGYWYPGEVTKVGDGTFTVKWEDPDGGPEESEVEAKDMKYPPIPFAKLEVGQKYTGTVRSVLDFGAFVDIGAESDGLLHISRISKEFDGLDSATGWTVVWKSESLRLRHANLQERIDNIYEELTEGQLVDVWISGKREDEGKYGLTMVEGLTDGPGRRPPDDLTPFADLSSDEWFKGVVARTAPFGAFVTVTLEGGEQADGLVHVSKIKDGFVDNVDDEVSVGQEVKVRIESVDLDMNRMSLSMREGFGGGGGFRDPVDLSAFESADPSAWVQGKVARLAPFGAFVTVTMDGSTADGLVHITQIRDGFVESVEDELSEGQEVEVRIESVDVDAGKMSLSMKPAE